MNKILGVIITYNPSIDLLKRNITSIINEIDELLVVDNNSDNINDIRSLVKPSQFISFDTNLGIANALQIALEFAKKNEYEYLLTMDQDSCFQEGSVKILKEGFLQNNIAIVCPSILDINSNHKVSVEDEYLPIFTTITSGSLCKVDSLIDAGGFLKELFIDYVDIEICLRLQKKGYKIMRSKNSFLYHQLGDSKLYKILGVEFISTNHSPLRRFYYSRNKFYIYKNYFFDFPLFVLRDFLSFIKTIFVIVFYEGLKMKKLQMIAKGIFSGIFKI